MKTNILLLALFLVAAATTSCHRKQAETVGKTEPAEVVKPKPEPPAAEPAEEAYQFAGYQKTPCYGTCPVYQVQIFSDGKATWYGRMNVERKGWYEGMVKESDLKRIREKVHEVKFLDFENQYPTGVKVADLPTTVIYIRIGDMEKTVKDTHDAPEKLKEFEKFMEDLIETIAWRPSENKD